MHPYQDIFMTCSDVARAIHSNVFEYLPGKDAVYPFIFIGEQMGPDTANKSAVFGTCYQTIHFYGNDWKQRGTLTKLMNQYLTQIRAVTETRFLYIRLLDSVNQQLLPDTTTGINLMHGILELPINFQHKGVK